jgi:hypothetical protein
MQDQRFTSDKNEAVFDGETLTLSAFHGEAEAAQFLSGVLVQLAEAGTKQVVLPPCKGRSIYRLLGFAVQDDVCVVWEPVFRGKLHEREVVPPIEQASWLAEQTILYKKPPSKKEKVTKKMVTLLTATTKKKHPQLSLF